MDLGCFARTLFSGSNQSLSLVESPISVSKVSLDTILVLATEKIVLLEIGPTLVCWDIDGHSILGTITSVSPFLWFISWRNKELIQVQQRPDVMDAAHPKLDTVHKYYMLFLISQSGFSVPAEFTYKTR